MLQRTITGVILIAIVISCLLFSPWTFFTLLFVLSLIGLREFYTLAEKTNHQPQRFPGLILNCCIFLGSAARFIPIVRSFSVIIYLLLIPCLFCIFILELYRKQERPFGNIAYTILGLIYISLPFSMLCFIPFHYLQQESYPFSRYSYAPEKILGILFILWASDTGAYLTGKSFGKHKLFERISPGKTWEGSIGGGIISLAVAYVVSLFYKDLSTMDWMIVSLIIVIIGNFGDLVESLFKRSIDAKDSGTILPGHGGILDRFDSLILSTPFIFTYLALTNKL